MMICKADFEELFPTTFPQKHSSERSKVTPKSGAAHTARREDDGGKVRSAPQRRTALTAKPYHHVDARHGTGFARPADVETPLARSTTKTIF